MKYNRDQTRELCQIDPEMRDYDNDPVIKRHLEIIKNMIDKHGLPDFEDPKNKIKR